MARIIILETKSARLIRYAMWADVPTERQKFYENPSFLSAYIDASAGDLAALRAGALVERVVEEHLDGTLAAVRTVIEGRFAVFQGEITSRNDWARYGTSFDGTTWTPGGAT